MSHAWHMKQSVRQMQNNERAKHEKMQRLIQTCLGVLDWYSPGCTLLPTSSQQRVAGLKLNSSRQRPKHGHLNSRNHVPASFAFTWNHVGDVCPINNTLVSTAAALAAHHLGAASKAFETIKDRGSFQSTLHGR
jgi:hypothetical protein